MAFGISLEQHWTHRWRDLLKGSRRREESVMNRYLTSSITFMVAFWLMGSAVSPQGLRGQDSSQAMKIGTFDSRAVALAFWRSDEGTAVLSDVQDELRAAREAGDEARVKELEAKGPGLQIRMMQQVFSTGTLTDVLRRVEDLVPSVAEKAGVHLIIPKWQITYEASSVETVDVTMDLVSLFSPTEDILARVRRVLDTEPIPIDELPMDPRG
jgi:hypothetical protein